MHTERLLRLEALLRKDADNEKGVKFDLGYWAAPSAGIGNYRLDGKWETNLPEPEVSCGTTACAMGLAAISGEFAKDGLGHHSYSAGLNPDTGGELFVLEPEYRGHTGFNAAYCFFDIDYEQARFLFDPDCYGRTPKGREGELFVADRIAEFVATDGASCNEDSGEDDYPEDDEDDEDNSED